MCARNTILLFARQLADVIAFFYKSYKMLMHLYLFENLSLSSTLCKLNGSLNSHVVNRQTVNQNEIIMVI